MERVNFPVDNRLTEQSRAADDIELDAARQQLADARAMSVEDGGYDDRQAAILRARAQIKLAEPASPY